SYFLHTHTHTHTQKKKHFCWGNRIGLITGAANGTGRQIALSFAPLGAPLALWDIDEEGNKERSRLARKNGAKRVFAYHCDCSSREEVYEQANKVRREVGDVTILINNASILLAKKFCVLEIDFLIFDISSCIGIYVSLTCKAFLPAMITCNHRHLASVASAAGFLGAYRMTDYSGSKCAVIGMMEAFNSELYHTRKHSIKTTIICPSFVKTELARGFQTQNQLLLPVYDAEHITSKIMDAIQKEKLHLLMPLILRFFGLKM
ncbi:RDHE2 dehydrogenase, partial [Chauna torquata]|nr:RDHE2 dehydrogenase [Chauna torquata]